MTDLATVPQEVGIEYGCVENIITVEPPLSRDQLEYLIGEGALALAVADDYEVTGAPGETTRIPFGRLILGPVAMDKATRACVLEIKAALKDLAA